MASFADAPNTSPAKGIPICLNTFIPLILMGSTSLFLLSSEPAGLLENLTQQPEETRYAAQCYSCLIEPCFSASRPPAPFPTLLEIACTGGSFAAFLPR